MRKLLVLLFLSGFIILASVQPVSASGLIYETKKLSDNKIRITLKWSNPSEAKGFFIESYYLEMGKILNIGYALNNKAQKIATLDFNLNACVPPIGIRINKSGDLNWRPFTDIKGIEAEKYIWHLHDAGIADSGSDGKFRPNDAITRGELAELICKALKISGTNDNKSGIKDIDKAKQKAYILTAVKKGLLGINKDKTFKPGNPVTIADACTLILKGFNLKAGKNGIYLKLKKGKTYSDSVKKIFDLNILNVEDKLYQKFNEEKNISKADFSMMLSRALML